MMNQNIDKAKLMKTITQASFAMDDVRLFLDTHPNCQEALEYYSKAKKIRDKAWDIYTENFGPLDMYGCNGDDKWMWNKGPMPWEGGKC